MEIIHAKSDSHRTSWQSYTEASPDSSFYHIFEWKNIIEECFGHRSYYLMASDKGVTRGVLPLIHIKSHLFGSIFCSMPFLNFGGVLASDRIAEEALLEESIRLMADHKVDYMELRQRKKNQTSLLTKDHKVSMTVVLQPDPEELWQRYSSKQRNEIRKGRKLGLQIIRGRTKLLDDFYDIICTGWRNHGTPIYSFKFFQKILSDFNEKIEVYIVLYNGKPIGTALNGLYKDTVEGMWTYVLPEFRNKNVNYFLYWEMIKQACENGYKIFHLGRSTKNTGGVDYKKKWNAEEEPLYWQYKLHNIDDLPDLSVQNRKYKIFINIWRKIPVPLTKIFGPPLAKNIP